MNCRACQQISLERVGEELPEEVSAHLLDCADCRHAYQRALRVQGLLRIKTYECPDPHFETRNLARVAEAIRDLPPPAAGWLGRLLEKFSGGTVPAVRYALAAMVLALVGINWLTVRSLPPLSGASIEALRPVQPALSRAVASGTNQWPGGPAGALPYELAGGSNQHPAQLQFGPQYGVGPSRPVKFDY